MKIHPLLFAFAIVAFGERSFAATKRAASKNCIQGPFHKAKPTPESEEFLECHSWKENACCKANLTVELHHYRAERIYHGYRYDRCGNISKSCEQYILDEECFYQCEPNTFKWMGPTNDTFTRVPICASYCDAWFDACKDDKTCVVDWLNDFDYSIDGSNQCPQDSTCRTFAEVYGDAAGLCNKMWAHAFKYETSDNCMVMKFDPASNPNDSIKPAP